MMIGYANICMARRLGELGIILDRHLMQYSIVQCRTRVYFYPLCKDLQSMNGFCSHFNSRLLKPISMVRWHDPHIYECAPMHVLKAYLYPLWVLQTCVSTHLICSKRLETNPIIHCWENVQKRAENCDIGFWQIFGSYWTFSQLRMIGSISSLLLLVRHLEIRV